MDQNLLDPSAIRRESEFESGGEGRGAAEVSFNLISTHDDDGHARFIIRKFGKLMDGIVRFEEF